MEIFINFIQILREILIVLLFARVIISWVGWKIDFIVDITDIFLKPIKSLVPPMGMIDFSPMIAYLLIELVMGMIIYFLQNI